jgi:FkbM family methyltransferase
MAKKKIVSPRQFRREQDIPPAQPSELLTPITMTQSNIKPAGWEKYGEEVAQEVSCYLPLGIRKGDVVMDVGSHHGHFALLAVEQGAAQVYCYEPAPENLVYLDRNTRDVSEIEVSDVALGGGNPEVRELWLNPGRNTGAHSLVKRRGRSAVKVLVLPFHEELEKINPDVAKIDIEGAEYELHLDCLEKVRAIAIEYHLVGFQRIEAKRVHRKIMSMGFRCVREPRDTGQNWHSYGIYRRD